MSTRAGESFGERGKTSAAISDSIVRLYAEFYGRGPTKARTFLRPEYALCVLEDVFTVAERTLVQSGNGEHVERSRIAFQEVMRNRFITIVEAASGQSVRAFLSSVSIEPEIATELFLFQPGSEAEDERDPFAGSTEDG